MARRSAAEQPKISNDPRNMLDRGIYATDETLAALDELENGVPRKEDEAKK